ncbi:MAG TPA: hypothetical protein VMG34_05125 [Bacteroidota bacterium]|nr:hypothetical protein [Bacteroidota bacterium]
MNASRRIASALLPSFVALQILLFMRAEAGDPATLRPVDSKTRPVPARSSGTLLKSRKGNAATDGQLLTSLKQQIWLAQHKGTAHQVRPRPIPSSKPAGPVSRNAQREAIRQSLQGFNHLPRYGTQAPPSVRGKIPGFNPFTPSKPAERSSGATVPASQGAVENSPSGVEGQGSSAFFLLFVAVAIALTGTALVLKMIPKRPARRPAETQQPPAVTRRPILAQAGEKQVDHIEPVPGDLSAEEEGAVELAQRFQRGQGEMQLVIDLQARRESARAAAPPISLSPRRKETRRRTKHVRRPAVGKGETDLLSHLQRFQSTASHLQRML